ncbi:Atpase yjee, putative to have essential role in cell wall biosynthesis [Balamuthia mandrillaris]
MWNNMLKEGLSVYLPSVSHTKKLASLVARASRPGDMLCFDGPMGSGKTTFIRHFIRAIFNDERVEVTSPTFVLSTHYEDPGHSPVVVRHTDLHRLSAVGMPPPPPAGCYEFEEVDSSTIGLVEWASVMRHYPRKSLQLRFEVNYGQRASSQHSPQKEEEEEEDRDQRVLHLRAYDDEYWKDKLRPVFGEGEEHSCLKYFGKMRRRGEADKLLFKLRLDEGLR